jgi:hypothetical protein
MKLALLKFSNTTNIGDEIQSLAVKQHVNDKDILYIDRDFTNFYAGEECALVMNGWFSHNPENFPPSKKITPIFFGFHLTKPAYETYRKHREYFKKHEPIGCRDLQTMQVLQEWGIKTYLSGCATMTFPERVNKLENPQIILCDVKKTHFSKNERADFFLTSHDVKSPIISPEIKFRIAEEFLKYYRDHCKLMITSKIHCAIPCFAMGIPVIYTGIQDYRTSIIDLIGISKIKLPLLYRLSYKELPLKKANYSEFKNKITDDLKDKLKQLNIKIK